MTAFLRFEAYDPASTGLTIVDSSVPVPANPTVLLDGTDWGNAEFEAPASGPRGGLGARRAGRQVKDRQGAVVLRVFGASKQDVITRVSQLHRIVDLMARFGGRVTRRDHNQTFRQHLDVLDSSGMRMQWDRRFSVRDVAQVSIPFVWAPYAVGDPMDITDSFAANTAADYALDAGAAGNAAFGSGVIDAVANFGVEQRYVHTAYGYTYGDHQVTVEAVPGSVITNAKFGAVLKRVDAANYLEVFVDDNGTNSRLTLRKVVAGAPTVLAGPTNLAARIVTGTQFTVRARIERNTVYAEYFAGPPAAAVAPTLALTAYVLTTAEAAVFGMGVRGRGGVSMVPQATDAQIQSLSIRPFTYRAAVLPDVFRVDGIPGDVDALMGVSIAGDALPNLDFALIGWTAALPPVNLVQGTSVLPAGLVTSPLWEIAAVANINAASTAASGSPSNPKFGGLSIQVTAVTANADSGAQRRVFRRFRKGVPYTFRIWVRATAGSTANVAARIGNAAANDVATSANTALSASWQLVSVVWTPTADREDAHLTVIRRTAGAADVWVQDGEEVYEGTVAPSLPSQVQGLGVPAPFGVLEAENTPLTSVLPITADANASAGFTVKKQAVLFVDPNALAQDDSTSPQQTVLVEVWGRLRLINNFNSMTAKARWLPIGSAVSPLLGAYTQEFGESGRSVYSSVPLSGTRSRFIRFGTLALPIGRATDRVAIEAKIDYVPGAIPANTGAKVPVAGANESNGSGTWTTPANTAAIDSAMTFPAGLGDSWRWKNFAFGVPGGATIVGIQVVLTANSTQPPGTFDRVNCRLSPDAGTTQTANKFVDITGTTPNNYVMGGPTDLWGRTWVDTEFSDANFRLILQDTGGFDERIDQIAVTVYYTTATDQPFIDSLLLVPARQRALTATGKDPTTNKWMTNAAATEIEKVIAPDLSGRIGHGGLFDYDGSFPSVGLGGAIMEIPAPATDVVIKLSDVIPDAPTRHDLSEAVNQTATVHFAVTPRWAILRDA